jgi:MoxR-like ATPase
VGKTSLAALAARSSVVRRQFTPDLLPSDVVGLTVWNRGNNSFDFRPGPVFNNIVLADEINRASPKTQAALLEAMAEDQVTVDGVTYPLSGPFMVIATQNPIEHEGTYPLPESQLDRFLMRCRWAPLPRRSSRSSTPTATTSPGRPRRSSPTRRRPPGFRPARCRRPQPRRTRSTSPSATRRGTPAPACPPGDPRPQRVSGPGRPPGRGYVIPTTEGPARPVLAYRLIVTPEAQLQGISPADALGEVLRAVPVPGGH